MFLTTNKIDLTKYSTLVVDREIVDWNGYYVSGGSGWNGHAFDTVYIFDTPTPQVVYGNSYKPTSLHNLDLIGQKPEGVYPKRETLNLDVASRTTSHYIGVAGEASGSSATFINCNLYNMYLETNVTAVTHTVNGKTINIQVNNADGLVTYSKVDIIVGGKVVKTFTGAELSSTMSYTLTSANTLHNVVSIRAAYSQGGGPEDIVGVDFDIVDESVQGMPFRNGIDENTVFCLRGDCYSHTLILKNDGTVWSCGYNGYGQLGLSNTYDQNTFTQVTYNVSNDVKDISTGGFVSLLVKNDGSLWVTGKDSYGGFGWNNTGFQYSDFAQTTYNIYNDVEKVACSGYHSCIIKTDGTVWTTGYNYYGQLGLGNTSNYKKFTQVTFGIYNDAVDIICGETHTMVLKKDGTVLACGQNNKGQVGTNGASTYSFAVVGKLNE